MKAEFNDAQAMAKSHPATFSAPRPDDLLAIKPGQHVKVSVKVVPAQRGCEAERFWLKVLDVRGVEIVATVDNDLLFTKQHGLKYLDVVTIEKRHVYSTFVP